MRDRFEVHVLAVEYPGYGICPGAKCDERGATESALTAFRFAREVLRWPLERILFLGRSIGTGPAITLAVEHAVKGLCLISPFLSVREVCRDVFGPFSYMIEERFPNKDHMPMIRSPCLVVHGQKDHTIPFRHGRELFETCRSRKRLVSPPEMDHNANLLLHSSDFVLPMLEFFSLPSQGLEEMQVPSWAFDKRLSPFYLQPPVKPPKLSKFSASSMLGTCGACTACGKCAMGPGPEQVANQTRWDGDLVEETITGAIEHVLGRKEDMVWAEAESCIEPKAVSDPNSPSSRVGRGASQSLPETLPVASEMIAGKERRALADDVFPMEHALGNVVAQELPMPPSDDAVPVIPHATVRRHPGRVPAPIGQASDSPMLTPFPIRASGGLSNPARPMMSWRPHVPPKIIAQSIPSQPFDSPENIFADFDEDFNEDLETTLIRI